MESTSTSAVWGRERCRSISNHLEKIPAARGRIKPSGDLAQDLWAEPAAVDAQHLGEQEIVHKEGEVDQGEGDDDGILPEVAPALEHVGDAEDVEHHIVEGDDDAVEEQEFEQIGDGARRPFDAGLEHGVVAEQHDEEDLGLLVGDDEHGEHRDGNVDKHGGLGAVLLLDGDEDDAGHRGEDVGGKGDQAGHEHHQQTEGGGEAADRHLGTFFHRRTPPMVLMRACGARKARGTAGGSEAAVAAAVHAAVGAVHGGADVAAAAPADGAGLVGAAAVLGAAVLPLPEQLIVGGGILAVLGVHLAGLLEALERVVEPSARIVDAALEEVPLRVAAGGGHAVEELLRLGQPSGIDHASDVRELGSALRIGAARIAAGLSARPALRDDRVVCLVDLLHLLLGQVGQGVVRIVVRVILFGKLPVCGLHLFVGGVGGDP